jgi:histone H3/H4
LSDHSDKKTFVNSKYQGKKANLIANITMSVAVAKNSSSLTPLEKEGKPKGVVAGPKHAKRNYKGLSTYLCAINAHLSKEQETPIKIGFTHGALDTLNDLVYAFAEVLCKKTIALSNYAKTPTISVHIVRKAVDILIDDVEMREDVFSSAISFHIAKYAQAELDEKKRLEELVEKNLSAAVKEEKTSITKSKKAGLRMPVTRFLNFLRSYGTKSTRVQTLAVVAIVAVLEAAIEDLINAARIFTVNSKRSRITSAHIDHVLRNREDPVLGSIFIKLLGSAIGNVYVSNAETLSRFKEVEPEWRTRKSSPKGENAEDGGAAAAAADGEEDEEAFDEDVEEEEDEPVVDEEDAPVDSDDEEVDEPIEEEEEEEEPVVAKPTKSTSAASAAKKVVTKAAAAATPAPSKAKANAATPASKAAKAPKAEKANEKKRAREDDKLPKSAPAVKKPAAIPDVE